MNKDTVCTQENCVLRIFTIFFITISNDNLYNELCMDFENNTQKMLFWQETITYCCFWLSNDETSYKFHKWNYRRCSSQHPTTPILKPTNTKAIAEDDRQGVPVAYSLRLNGSQGHENLPRESSPVFIDTMVSEQ